MDEQKLLAPLSLLNHSLGKNWQFEINRFGKGELTVHNLNAEGFGIVAYELPADQWGEMGREGVDLQFAQGITFLLNNAESLIEAEKTKRTLLDLLVAHIDEFGPTLDDPNAPTTLDQALMEAAHSLGYKGPQAIVEAWNAHHEQPWQDGE